MSSPQDIRTVVAAEVSRIRDTLLRDAFLALQVEPQRQHRDMPDGAPGARYPTWLIACSRDFPIGLAYSELGYGPTTPWGYVSINHLSLGDQVQWFPTLEEAFRASGIWRRGG